MYRFFQLDSTGLSQSATRDAQSELYGDKNVVLVDALALRKRRRSKQWSRKECVIINSPIRNVMRFYGGFIKNQEKE